MFAHMAQLAMDGNRYARLHPGIHRSKLVARGVARHMHEMVAFGEHRDASRSELILQLEDRELIARNDARRENHRVALAQTDSGMFACRDARQCRPRLALASRAKIKHMV